MRLRDFKSAKSCWRYKDVVSYDENLGLVGNYESKTWHICHAPCPAANDFLYPAVLPPLVQGFGNICQNSGALPRRRSFIVMTIMRQIMCRLRYIVIDHCILHLCQNHVTTDIYQYVFREIIHAAHLFCPTCTIQFPNNVHSNPIPS